MTLEKLMAIGDGVFETRVIPGTPDWEALHDSTPDDTEDGEGEPEEDDEKIEAGSDITAPDLLRRMEEAAAAGITDPDTAAAALAVAWLRGAGEDPEKVAEADLLTEDEPMPTDGN